MQIGTYQYCLIQQKFRNLIFEVLLSPGTQIKAGAQRLERLATPLYTTQSLANLYVPNRPASTGHAIVPLCVG